MYTQICRLSLEAIVQLHTALRGTGGLGATGGGGSSYCNIYHVESKKTAPFYFCNNFAKPSSILIIFGIHVRYLSKFPIGRTFHILYKMEGREPA